jgi:hypothetical protein
LQGAAVQHFTRLPEYGSKHTPSPRSAPKSRFLPGRIKANPDIDNIHKQIVEAISERLITAGHKA